MKFRKRYLVLLAAPALLGMLMIVHTAGAATSGSPVVQDSEAKTLEDDVDGGKRLYKRGRKGGNIVAATVETLGLERDAVISQLRDGSTLEDVIVANGGTVDAVIDVAAQLVSDKLDEAVAGGKITAEQAADRLASFREIAASFLTGHRFDGTGYQGGRSYRSAGPKIARGVIGATAQVLGLEASAVVEELKAGGTLDGILAEYGGSADDVIAQVIARVDEKLDDAVEAGKLTQEDAHAHLAKAQQAATDLLGKEGILSAGAKGEHKQQRPGGQHRGRGIAGVAQVLGVHPSELATTRRDGQTIADFAASLGIDTATIVDELTAAQAERLSNAVERGRVTAEQADDRIEKMRAAVERFLQHVPNQV